MYKKQGYLKEDIRIFELKDKSERSFEFHYHDFFKIIIFLSGKVVYNIEGKNYELKPSDIVLVAKDEIHKPIIDPDYEYERIVLYLSQSFLRQDEKLSECFSVAKENHTNVMRLSNVDFSRLVELLHLAVKKEKTNEYAGKLLSGLHITEGLLLINESVHKNGLLFEGSVSYDKKIVAVCEYINSHLSEEITVEILSDKFYISKYYLMRKFKEYTGITIHNYILEKRILLTKELTDSGEKITTACIDAGFKDYSTYLRAKKRMANRLVGAFEAE